MFLSKNPNGKYYIYHEKSNGRRTCKSTGTGIKKDAVKFPIKFPKELEVKENQKFIPIKLEDFAFNFLRYSEPFIVPRLWKFIRLHSISLKSILGKISN